MYAFTNNCLRCVRGAHFRALTTSVLLVVAIPPTVIAQPPLFESSELLELRLEAPFRRMISEQEGRFPARILLSSIPTDTINLEIAPRGESRLRSGICDFPGLMLFFSDSLVGTPFEGQGALPAVTHCKDRDSYEQLMLLEYLAYRAYNVLTELSLRVRLAHIEYYDSERDRSVAERYGFLLEHWDFLAERNGWTQLSVPIMPPDEYDVAQRSLFEVFQYFLGNTDWSFVFPSPDEDICCHNAIPVGNFAGQVFPVPFDFDQAGLVDAPYATVDPSLPIRRVRDRLFRGICGPPGPLNETLGLFEVRQAEIKALFEEAYFLSPRSRSRSLSYIEDFFETISDDRQVERGMISKCREPSN